MSRLSKYVKEKIVKVLVAALLVGTVAGNGTLTVQAEEAATVVGEESVSGGDAVVKENVVADPEVTPEANETVNAVTVCRSFRSCQWLWNFCRGNYGAER